MMPSQSKPNVNTVWASGGLATPVDVAKQALGFIAEIPDYAAFNGMIQQISAFQKHVNQEGVAVWDASTQYYTNGYAKANGTVYIALQDTLNNPPPALGATNVYWRDLFARIKDFTTDTGAANAYVGVYAPALVLANGLTVGLKAANANTGASTFNGLPIVGLGHAALQGGEIVANGLLALRYNSSVGGGSWVLVSNTGGGLPIAGATQSQHAMQLGQAVGRVVNTQVITVVGTSTYIPTPGAKTVRFTVQAGGARGGDTTATSSTQLSVAPGGGSGGCAIWEGPVATAAGLTMTVGAGGNHTISAGGASSVGSLATATGGAAPATAAALAPNLGSAVGIPGKGGLFTAGDPRSGNGVSGEQSHLASNSNDSLSVSGSGGASRFGGGGRGIAANGGFPGEAAVSKGAGGGGASANISKAAQLGGDGAPGVIIIEEFS